MVDQRPQPVGHLTRCAPSEPTFLAACLQCAVLGAPSDHEATVTDSLSESQEVPPGFLQKGWTDISWKRRRTQRAVLCSASLDS
mmetsp:Transcript_11452/g.24619  ORF Transcript_11452/g.24619 Transcript_11452/m.24619 type:complete len:84 (-) Transcript_11452:876-1127(-)